LRCEHEAVRCRRPALAAGVAAPDYIEDRRAAGLSVRSVEGDIRVRLERVFLPWCRENGITDPEQLDQRTINRFSTNLMDGGGAKGQPLSPHTVAAYVKTTNPLVLP
jgi:hypothetical protein